MQHTPETPAHAGDRAACDARRGNNNAKGRAGHSHSSIAREIGPNVGLARRGTNGRALSVPAVTRVLCLMNPEMPEPRERAFADELRRAAAGQGIVPAARAQIDYLKVIKSYGRVFAKAGL